ncbi:MAG: hypothetical protein A4E64_00169 [Syntrophorhabdus sp. PtaU1.Bin058]|nr:MAG: hypothetical protein A4E64_00169 [Syntrophorhabdus sp. PtaU1.Bin058]
MTIRVDIDTDKLTKDISARSEDQADVHIIGAAVIGGVIIGKSIVDVVSAMVPIVPYQGMGSGGERSVLSDYLERDRARLR